MEQIPLLVTSGISFAKIKFNKVFFFMKLVKNVFYQKERKAVFDCIFVEALIVNTSLQSSFCLSKKTKQRAPGART